MAKTFDLQKLEKLENFMSLKRCIGNDEVRELQAALYPKGATRTVTPSDIADLEKRLNVVAPALYRKFLLEYGYAMWFGGTVHGITPGHCTEPDLDPSVLSLTESVRGKAKAGFAPFVRDSFVIDKDDAGGYFVLASASVDPEGRVDLVVREFNKWMVAASWPSFADYLFHVCEQFASDQ